MTVRTGNEKSAIERATEDVMADINSAITHEWKAHGVPVPEAEFRRIIALYFERKTLREWASDLGVQIKSLEGSKS
jgi:hypothetical protein